MLDELFLYGSSNRACLSAVAAANALVSVDNVDITLCNAGCGALASACATSDAIVSNLVCHFSYLHFNNDYIYFSIFTEKIKRVF